MVQVDPDGRVVIREVGCKGMHAANLRCKRAGEKRGEVLRVVTDSAGCSREEVPKVSIALEIQAVLAEAAGDGVLGKVAGDSGIHREKVVNAENRSLASGVAGADKNRR